MLLSISSISESSTHPCAAWLVGKEMLQRASSDAEKAQDRVRPVRESRREVRQGCLGCRTRIGILSGAAAEYSGVCHELLELGRVTSTAGQCFDRGKCSIPSLR